MGRLSAVRRPRGARDDEGFTLIEVIAALFLFAVLSTATVTLIVQALQTIHDNNERVLVANVARSQVEYLRLQGTSGITIGLTEIDGDASTTDMVPRGFTARTTAAWVGLGQESSACNAAEPGQSYLRIRVEVTGPKVVAPAVVDTVIAPESLVSTTGTGAAAISVIDHMGSPVSDVVVTGVDTAHPANSFSFTTGSDGCLYIPGLVPTSALQVTINRAGSPAYVASTPTGTTMAVAIAAQSLARPTFHYAPAAAIDFTGDLADFPLAEGMPVRWQLNETGAISQVGAVGTPVTGKWPATTGFSAWAGDCPDADPEGYVALRQSFGFVAGGTGIAALDVRPVRLRGLPADVPVTAAHVGGGAGCTNTPVVVGRSNDKGILRIGLPNGDWVFASEGQSQPLEASLAPPAPETEEAVTTVNFTLANLDAPSPSPSGSASPGATEPVVPAPSGSVTP